MNLTERDLEDWICNQELIKVNDRDIRIVARQVKVGSYYIDVLGLDDENGDIYIFELKQNKIDGNALSQLLNYMYFVNEYRKGVLPKVDIKGVLIGDGMSDYMRLGINMVENVCFIDYNISFDLVDEHYGFSKSYTDERLEEDSINFNELIFEEIDEIIALKKDYEMYMEQEKKNGRS